MSMNMTNISWVENDVTQTSVWKVESSIPAPKRIQIADDMMKADVAYRLACEGTGLLWRGDFQNAKQLLQAMNRRLEKKVATKKIERNLTLAEQFHLHRQAQSQRARILAMLLIQINADYSIPLRRAPAIQHALTEAYGIGQTSFITSLREILGIIGAHEWHKKGVHIPILNEKIYPSYGVYSPIRGEYLDLLQQAPLPSHELAFDIGTGTGVISILLAKRGVKKIIATDLDSRAIDCANKNILQFSLEKQIQVLQTDLFPPQKAPLIVCNPPWIPARPSSKIENALYDYESKMLKAFLAGLSEHLEENGEGWLILSDLAEHLGLRSRQELLELFELGRLNVVERMDISPRHQKAQDQTDPLFQARSQEITSLWRLKKKLM